MRKMPYRPYWSMRHFYIKILFLKKSLLLFYEVAMSIAFLRKIMVRMLYFILLSLKNDTCNSFQTKIREPRVQTRLSVAEGEGFEPPDTDQGVVRFQVECIQPDSANLPNDVFERIFEQSIAWFF